MLKKQITPKSWILLDNGQPNGLVIEINNGLSFMVEDQIVQIDGWKDLEDIIGKIDLHIQIEKKQLDVNGYPVKLTHTIATPVSDNKLPLYQTGGNVVFVAGYWVVNFANSRIWQVIQSPKLSTVQNNESLGPFKNRLEAMHENNKMNGKK